MECQRLPDDRPQLDLGMSCVAASSMALTSCSTPSFAAGYVLLE